MADSKVKSDEGKAEAPWKRARVFAGIKGARQAELHLGTANAKISRTVNHSPAHPQHEDPHNHPRPCGLGKSHFPHSSSSRPH